MYSYKFTFTKEGRDNKGNPTQEHYYEDVIAHSQKEAIKIMANNKEVKPHQLMAVVFDIKKGSQVEKTLYRPMQVRPKLKKAKVNKYDMGFNRNGRYEEGYEKEY